MKEYAFVQKVGETSQARINIVSDNDWLNGQPKDPNIPKWLIEVGDKNTGEIYVPTDPEFENSLFHRLDRPTLQLIYEAFRKVETHNSQNLLNRESRPIITKLNRLIHSKK